MAGFGAYMLAGAAAGAGDALIERARSLREERMMMLERQWELDDRAAAEASRAARGSGGGSRSSGNSRAKLDPGAEVRIRRGLEASGALGGLDDEGDLISAVEAEAERLLRAGQAATSEEAERMALNAMEFDQEEVTTGEGWFDGPRRTETVQGGWTGRFGYDTAAPDGQADAPEQTDPPEAMTDTPRGFGPAAGMTPDPTPETSATPPVPGGARSAPKMDAPEALSADEEADLITQAQSTLAAGADPEALLQRMIEAGVPEDAARRILNAARRGA